MRIIQEIAGYALAGTVALAVLVVPFLPVCLLLRKKIRILRQTVYFVLGVCVLVILCATLTGRIVPPSERSRNLVPFRMFTEPWLMGREKKITQIIANIVMFAPPGMLLPMAFLSVRRFWKTAAAMGAFSFIIEFIQYFIGRQADIDDFMLNAAGGMLGYLIFALCKKLWKEKKIWKSLTEKTGYQLTEKGGHHEYQKRDRRIFQRK